MIRRGCGYEDRDSGTPAKSQRRVNFSLGSAVPKPDGTARRRNSGHSYPSRSFSLMWIRTGVPVEPRKIVAVGLLTQRDVDVLGHGFSRLWPVDETPCFSDLLQAIDEADRELRQEHHEIKADQ